VDMKPILDSLTSTVDACDIVPLSDDAATFTLPMHFTIKAKGRPSHRRRARHHLPDNQRVGLHPWRIAW